MSIDDVTRRSVLQLLAALAAGSSPAAQQAGGRAPDDPARERLARLRALEIDDAVAPAVRFDPRPAGQRRGR